MPTLSSVPTILEAAVIISLTDRTEAWKLSTCHLQLTVPLTGCRVELIWPLEVNYYQRSVASVSDDGLCLVFQDDADVENLDQRNS